jgi:hypothetical protein
MQFPKALIGPWCHLARAEASSSVKADTDEEVGSERYEALTTDFGIKHSQTAPALPFSRPTRR